MPKDFMKSIMKAVENGLKGDPENEKLTKVDVLRAMNAGGVTLQDMMDLLPMIDIKDEKPIAA